jgi:hypothetical protein
MTGARAVGTDAEIGAIAVAQTAPPGPTLAPAGSPEHSISAAGPANSPAPRPAKTVDNSLSYRAHRLALAALASLFGVVASLPQAGPELTRQSLQDAGRRRVLFTDFDDTLGPYNTILLPEMAAAITAVMRAGKQVVIITDRSEVREKGSAQMTAFESVSSIAPADRAGLILAATSGGHVYRYNDLGDPEKIWEYPALEGRLRDSVAEAAEAIKCRLPQLGTSQHPGDYRGPAEVWGTYGYSLMLAAGTPEPVVKAVAHVFEEELKKRSLGVAVEPRMAKNPALPPYVRFSLVDKSAAARHISEMLVAETWETVALGDNMYRPRQPEKLGFVGRAARYWAERLSGRPIALTGNETDRNMEKALPGMLALSVGGTADPRMHHAFVLPGRGQEASLEVLRAMAAEPAIKADPARYWKLAAAGALLIVFAIMIALGWLMFWQAFVSAAAAYFSPQPGIWELFQ